MLDILLLHSIDYWRATIIRFAGLLRESAIITAIGVNMFQYCIYAIVLISSTSGPADIVPAFRDSVLAGNALSAVEMVSTEAILQVDSVLEHNPEQVDNILLYFGLQIELQEINEMDGRQLLTEILSSPSLSGLILIFGFTPEEPVEHRGRMFVPILYGVFGESRTIYLEIVSEQDKWKIRDFFEELP
jgi:hypothetical protein